MLSETKSLQNKLWMWEFQLLYDLVYFWTLRTGAKKYADIIQVLRHEFRSRFHDKEITFSLFSSQFDINVEIHSFILLSVLQQVHSFFEYEFPTECD
jgi:hypothetical protein